MPAPAFHDRVHHGQAEPGVLASYLAGKERVEDAVDDVAGDPGPGVTNPHSRVPVPGNAITWPLIIDARRVDGHSAALRHGLAGVVSQAGEEMLDVTTIREDFRHVPAEVELQRDPTSDPAGNQLPGAFDDVVQAN